MTDQMDLFAARAARDDAVALVGARGPAMRAAYDAARAIVSRGQPFTAEAIRAWMATHDPDGERLVAKEPRVMGAVMCRLAREGHARPTDRHVVTGRVVNHARPQRVWVPTEGREAP